MLLDVTGRAIVIVGGGGVAARKAEGLIAAGAKGIRCISPAFCAEMPAAVERVAETYAAGHLQGAGLVFAATDAREVNDAVVRDARRLGVLVNRADSDDAEPGDFATPAKFQRGAVIVTVSAGSAALSAAIRDDLERRLDARWIAMADAMRSLRPAILASGLTPALRTRIFRELAVEEAMAVLESGGVEALFAWLQRKFPEVKHG